MENRHSQSRALSSRYGGEAAERTILVAVDFGTTFSGLAWAQTRRPDVQTTINQWPMGNSEGLEGRTSDKVPTELRYGRDGSFEWGFQIPDEGARHQWFKLDLDPSQRHEVSGLASEFRSRNALPPAYNVKPEKLVEDYLRALRLHVERVLNHKLPQAALKSTAIEYIITTPAVWSDRAQALTRQCAENAGMGQEKDIQMISEPEAAAIHALDAMNPHDIRVGDTFVICDAGGGTVDLISYTVEGLNPILKVKEAATGTGGLCGSSYLNRIFEKYLIERFENNDGWEDEVLEDAVKRFEEITKRRFSGHENETFTIPLPGLVNNTEQGVNRSKFILKGSDVARIFDPVTSEIIRLVRSQITATKCAVQAILLVGGFGESAYLLQSLRRALGTDIEVLVPPNSWTSVVRGALMKGLARGSTAPARVQVSSRLARKHYGASFSYEFNPESHRTLTNQRYWNGFYGHWRVSCMNWFVKKGDEVKEDEPRRFAAIFHISNREMPAQQVDIYVCADPDNKGAPLLREEGVQKLAKLRIDLLNIPKADIQMEVGNDGLTYYILNCEIIMTHYSASTKYELLLEGVRYSSVVAEHV